MNTRELIKASEQLTDRDIETIEGARKALMRLIESKGYGLIRYEELERVAGKRGPARMWDLKRLGFIKGYETIKRKGSTVFDYKPIPVEPKKSTQMQLIQVEQKKVFDW